MLALFFLPLALLLALAQTTPSAEPSPLGSIEGTVLDGAGKPLADATVYALPEQDMRRQVRTQTDASGRFVLKDVPAGGAYLNAFKETEGYPYNFFAFFQMPGQGPPTRVMVKAEEIAAGVTIRLGVKAAVLTLKITDENGAPLAARAEFQRPDLGSGGNYGTALRPEQILDVPPVPFRLTIERDGYAPWHYGGNAWEADEGLLKLQPGQRLDVMVRLRLGEASATATTGSIRGTVFGAEDEPIAAASVYAESEDGKRLVTTTTAAGTFIMNRVQPGTFHLWAWKSDGGYSHELRSPFFALPDRQLPTVSVTPGDVAAADIRLGPKNAYLNLLITDEQGKPITNSAHVVFSRPDSPERLEKDVRDRAFIAVPSTPMRVSVEADGYSEWHYGGDKWLEDKGLVAVSPGEILDLKVQLHHYR